MNITKNVRTFLQHSKNASRFIRFSISTLLLLLMAAFPSNVRAESKPFVWEVKSANKPGTVYLVGSIHILHSYDPLPPIIDTVFAHCQKTIFELNLDHPKAVSIVESKAYLPSGDSLDKYLQSSTYQSLQNFLKSKGADIVRIGNDSPVPFNRLRPWLAFTLTSQIKLSGTGLSGDYGVDRRLLTRAQQSGKTRQFLETYDVQIQAMENALRGYEDAAILSVLKDSPQSLVTAWLSGDTARLQKVVNDAYTLYPSVYSALISQRNWNWLPTIEAQLSQNQRTMVVVGTAHMLGNSGLVTLLRNRGYSVERLPGPARVLSQPATVSTLLNSSVTLTALASGSPPLTYQWRKNDETIPGATNSVFTIANVESDANYSFTVSNFEGDANSSDTSLKVYDPALFTPLCWQSSGRQLAWWLMDNTNFSAAVSVRNGTSFVAGWSPEGLADFNADGMTDFLFQNSNGALAVWLMRGTTLFQAATLKAAGAGWRVNGLGNFSGTNVLKNDILFRDTSGRLALWFMNGTNFISSSMLNGGKALAANWRVAAVANFDGDQDSDLLLQNDVGQVAVWLMEGVARQSSLFLRGGLRVADWKVVGASDFGTSASDSAKDGKADILFLGANRQLAVWYMDGTNYVSSASLAGGKKLAAGWKGIE